MTTKLSPIIVTFKALPGVLVVAVRDPSRVACEECSLKSRFRACGADTMNPKGNCAKRDYIWREVKGEK